MIKVSSKSCAESCVDELVLYAQIVGCSYKSSGDVSSDYPYEFSDADESEAPPEGVSEMGKDVE